MIVAVIRLETMDSTEQHRLRELAQIVGEDSVVEFAFYDDVDYDNLICSLTVRNCSEVLSVLRDVRKLADITLAHAKAAITQGTKLYSVALGQCPGPIERRRAIVTLEKMKNVVENHGATATIELRSIDNSFERTDCGERELNYVKTRIITWM